MQPLTRQTRIEYQYYGNRKKTKTEKVLRTPTSLNEL
jgi:hypothetical protein